MIYNWEDLRSSSEEGGSVLGDSLTTTFVPLNVNYTNSVPFVRRASGASLEPTAIKNGSIASAGGSYGGSWFGGSPPTGFQNSDGFNYKITLPSNVSTFQQGSLTRDSDSAYRMKTVFWWRIDDRSVSYNSSYTYDCSCSTCTDYGKCNSPGWRAVYEDYGHRCLLNGINCDFAGGEKDAGVAACGCAWFDHCCYKTRFKEWKCDHGHPTYSCNCSTCYYPKYDWYTKYNRYYWMNMTWWYYDQVEVYSGTKTPVIGETNVPNY